MTALTNIAALYRDREALPLRTRVLVTFGAVAALHAAAVVLLASGTAASWSSLVPGLVLASYAAGIKHSYDWDHIAAIDNSTRKFVARRKDPASVGFAFSLGHSSVVVLAGLLVVAGVALAGELMEAGTGGNHVLGLIGSGVSGAFLLAMGLFNGAAFLRAARAYGGARAGATARAEDLDCEGLVARLLARPLAGVQKPRHIYVIGFLFGLGFDTATTVGLLVATAAASLAGVPPVALLALPLAFAAAMTLCDTINGLAMMRMYRTALEDPQRKLGFNALVTGLSAASALFIAAITLGGFADAAFAMENPVTRWLGAVDLGHAGLLLVGLLLAVWGAAALQERTVKNRPAEPCGPPC